MSATHVIQGLTTQPTTYTERYRLDTDELAENCKLLNYLPSDKTVATNTLATQVSSSAKMIKKYFSL